MELKLQTTLSSLPTVDVNLLAHNSVETVGATIESVLSQTWPKLSITLIDDGSTDGTLATLERYAASHSSIRVKPNRWNGGTAANIQRALWHGDSDYVMPKSADDLLAPDFIERIMDVLLRYPLCLMCHARGLVCTGELIVHSVYPLEHCLHAVEADPVARACHVMARYTTSPSFWGVYRRSGVERLGPVRDGVGWDHVLLAELALHGEIRHVPAALYWQRGESESVLDLTRAAMAGGQGGLADEESFGGHRWRTPLISTAYAHLEAFARTRLPLDDRLRAMRAVPEIFRERWLEALQREAGWLRAELPEMLAQLQTQDSVTAAWMLRTIISPMR